MRDQDGPRNSDSTRSAIDRYAVIAASQVLMSSIWIEHRVRRFPMRLRTLSIGQRAGASAVSSSASRQSDRGQIVRYVPTTEPLRIKRERDSQ
jgi:hypothetical protein